MADIICAGNLFGAPMIRWYDIAASQTISAGDPIVMLASGRVRVATDNDGEDSAQWAHSTASGILGFAAAPIVSTSAGIAMGQIVPSGVSAGAVPALAVPQMSAAVPIDAGTGYSRLPVWIAHPDQRFLIKLSGGNTTAQSAITVDDAYVGTKAGLALSDTTSEGWFALNGATYPIFVVDDVERTDPYYNTSSINCHVYVRPLSSYCQVLNGNHYDS